MVFLILMKAGYLILKALQMLFPQRKASGTIPMLMALETINLQMHGNQIVAYLRKVIVIEIDGDAQIQILMELQIQTTNGLHIH